MHAAQVACFESHRKAWKRVVDEEWRQAIIMEDDADVDLSVNMNTVASFIAEAPPDWQLLYLGINNPQVRHLADL
jgi:glycosyl transferase family 25